MLRSEILKIKYQMLLTWLVIRYKSSTTLNAKINDVKGKMTNISNLTTTAALTAVEIKIPNIINLVKN